MTYVELKKRGLLEKRAERRRTLIEKAWLPRGVERAKDWDAVIKWVEAFDEQKQAS